MNRRAARCWRIAAVLVAVTSRSSAANPDGPLGSLCVTPRFAMTSQANYYTYQYQYAPGYPQNGNGYIGPTWPAGKSWVAGIDLLIPVTAFATLGMGAEQVHGPGVSGRTTPEVPNEIQQSFHLEGENRVNLSLQLRFYIPLSSRARDELARQR